MERLDFYVELTYIFWYDKSNIKGSGSMKMSCINHMHIKEKKKGFTMVELLAVIVILGILVACVIAAVQTNLKEAERQYYASQEQMVTMSGRDYFSDYLSKLPKEIGVVERVSLKTLIQEDYIEQVLDRDKNVCDYTNSYVAVQKQGEKLYQYYTFLKCSDYDGSKDGVNPSIAYIPHSKKTNKNLTVQMQIRDDKKVEAYSYIVYKNNTLYRQTSKKTYHGQINISLTEEGEYKIVGTAYDSEGNIGMKTSGTYLIDKTPPNCGQVVFQASQEKETWTNQDVSVKVTVPSNIKAYEWFERKDSSSFTKKSSGTNQTFTRNFTTTGTHQGKVILYDEVGNSCTKTTPVYYIDKTMPTVTLEGSISSGGLTNQNVRLIATPTPTSTPSLYTYYFEEKINGSFTVIHQSSTPTYTVTDEGVHTYRVRIRTGAGNEGISNTYQFEIDKTPPDCGTITFSSSFQPRTWYNQKVSFTVLTNNLDIVNYDISTRQNGGSYSISGYNRTSGYTHTYQVSGQHQSKVKAYDRANNFCEKESNVYYMDLEPPVISKFTASSRDSYHSLNVNLRIEASDLTTMSMCISETGYEKNCTYEPYTTSKNITLSGSLDGRRRVIYLTVKDAAGNTSKDSVTYTPYVECSSTRTTVTNGSCRGACGTGSRTVTTMYYDSYTGAYCRQSSKEESCNTGIDCCGSGNMEQVGSWIDTSTCNVSCGIGTKTQKILRRSKLDTSVSCPDEVRTISCDTGISCCTGPTTTYGNWSSCSGSCGTGTRTRTKTVTECDGSQTVTTESQSCNTGVDCCSSKEDKWTAGSWSSCSYYSNTKKRRWRYHKSLLDGSQCDGQWQYSTSGCFSATILNSSYTVCPEDQLRPSDAECSSNVEAWNYMRISNATIQGTTLSLKVDLHMNVTATSFDGYNPDRTLCIADTNGNCVINLHAFSANSASWLSPGAVKTVNVSTNISGLSAGTYRIIVSGNSTKFRFQTTHALKDLFRVN